MDKLRTQHVANKCGLIGIEHAAEANSGQRRPFKHDHYLWRQIVIMPNVALETMSDGLVGSG